ncbi:MAG: GerW family sporulation protein [Thermoflexaceae bacterium]|nr:GerW family sporulation protein [Thermoflexaceae bacterium]
MAENEKFNATVESLFKGMDSFISAKTVVGDAVHINDTIILPLVDVSFGVAAGASNADKKSAATGGMGGKISPSAVLVIKGDQIRLVNVKNQDAVTKIIDMVPDLINKFTGKNEDVTKDSQVSQAIDEVLSEESNIEE